MSKSNREAAYKQLAIEPADQWAAIVALRRREAGKWFGFVTRALVSGSVAAVLRYNIISRIRTALARQLLGVPLVG